MNIFKRWTIGIASGVDAVVAKIENHEALINSAILDYQKNMSRAQVQLQAVKRDGDALRQRVLDEEKAESSWKERARSALTDEELALDCLKRSKRAARNAAQLKLRLDEHTQTEAGLVKDLGKLKDGLLALKEQRNLMRTRQSRAKAMVAIRDGQGRMTGDVEEIFERWEMHVAEREIEGGCFADPIDPLEERFKEEEERDALRLELDALRREHD